MTVTRAFPTKSDLYPHVFLSFRAGRYKKFFQRSLEPIKLLVEDLPYADT